MTNETITLTANEGLQIDFSRIVYPEDSNELKKPRPSWLTTHFTAEHLEKALGSLTFTEDDLEKYLKSWLENTLTYGVKSFRWLWDKYRDYKVA